MGFYRSNFWLIRGVELPVTYTDCVHNQNCLHMLHRNGSYEHARVTSGKKSVKIQKSFSKVTVRILFQSIIRNNKIRSCLYNLNIYFTSLTKILSIKEKCSTFQHTHGSKFQRVFFLDSRFCNFAAIFVILNRKCLFELYCIFFFFKFSFHFSRCISGFPSDFALFQWLWVWSFKIFSII